jgi:CHAT domain-containing protein
MSVLPNNEETVREYLLGRISDEATLEAVENLLFSDQEFCAQVELAEEDLINDYVMGRLNTDEAENFRATFPGNRERHFKVKLTEGLREQALARKLKSDEGKPSFFASAIAFLRQPKYAIAFAVLVVAGVTLLLYFNRQPRTDDLAELRRIYEQSRPTQSRISAFAYAPLSQLRGPLDAREENRLRRIENNLIDATEKDSNARSHHALGVFRLTQQKYPEAIKEFETALKFAPNDAQIHNDLGVAHFELAKSVDREKKYPELARSLEEFTKATQLDPNLLEALFNKSLTYQELETPREAKESWNLYLQKDPSSPWANEARKNLVQLEAQSSVKEPDQILSDFLTAFRNNDDASAQKIHNQTKGPLNIATVPLQLARRYLAARQKGHQANAKEYIEALRYIGEFEQAKNGDSFFFELANFYASVDARQLKGLSQAHDALAGGQELRNGSLAISQFEKSRDLFTRLGDSCDAAVAESWAAQYLNDVGRIAEGRSRLAHLMSTAESKSFMVLLPPAYYWLGMGDYNQRLFSESGVNLLTALGLAQITNNDFEVEYVQHALAVNYSELGEIETSLRYAGPLLGRGELYYQNPVQDWRNKGVLADLALKLECFATALALGRERLAMAREPWAPRNLINDSFRLLIEVATASKDFSAALEYASQSMQEALAGGDKPESTRKIAEIYYLQADVNRQLKNYREALSGFDKALELYQRLPEVTDSLYKVHRGKLFCFQQLNWQDAFSSELQIVFKFSELYRATIREDASRQTFFASEQDVFDAATANFLSQRDSQNAFASSEASRARSLLDFVESDKSIAQVEKSFGPVAQPLSLTEIRARLPEQVQLVQYAVLPDKLVIWTVSKTRFDLLERQITATELQHKIDSYQELLSGRNSPAEIKQAAEDLYKLLVPADLVSDKQLCLVPDKSLHQLAFATLVAPNGNYLLQSYALSYSPSASVLVLASENARQREEREESVLSVGNPDFDRQENLKLPDLKDAESEAKTIAADYSKSQTFLGAYATKETFLKNLAGVEVIHFAGHFLANRRSPANSKLLLAGGELRAAELGSYKLPIAKLVVLSACETGFEYYNKSEGAIGIARTWLALGAPIVVASQWKVDSETTKDLMIAFHRNRKQKRMTSAESLRQAQLELLSRDQTKAPHYWAAFALFGGYTNY